MPGIAATAARELAYWRSHRWEPALAIAFPAVTLIVLLWLFSTGVPIGLPIAVVDEDHSPESRELVRRIDATRSASVIAQPARLVDAWPLVRSGKVYGVVHIPPGWSVDRMRGAPQPVVLYDNAQYLLVAGIVGNEVNAAVASMLIDQAIVNEARAGGGFEAATARVTAVGLDLRTMYNPSLSYEAYLAGMVSPAMLHLFAVIAAVAALGREFRDRTVPAWLDAAGGSFWRALLGKLLPVGIVYVVLATLLVATLAGVRGWVVAGSIWLWLLSLYALMAASLAIAVLFVGVRASLREALSLTGVYVATAVAFSGFSFPRAAMGEAARAWSEGLPFTHYLPLQEAQWLAGTTLASWAEGTSVLLLFTIVPLLAGWPLLAHECHTPAAWGRR